LKKSDIIKQLGQKQVHLPENIIALCIKNILHQMTKHLTNGHRIEIRNFGNFQVRYHQPRTAHNPQTGEMFKTKETFVIRFKAGKGMKDRINMMRHQPIQKLNQKKEKTKEE
jgi:integration host factor subunit beta